MRYLLLGKKENDMKKTEIQTISAGFTPWTVRWNPTEKKWELTDDHSYKVVRSFMILDEEGNFVVLPLEVDDVV